MRAAYNNNIEMVHLLLDRGADSEVADKVSSAFHRIQPDARKEEAPIDNAHCIRIAVVTRSTVLISVPWSDLCASCVGWMDRLDEGSC
jgi:ankyrin repeat protein